MNVKELARRAGVSRSLVYKWAAERLIPHTRLGGKGRRGKVVFREEDVAAFLAARRVEAARDEPPALNRPSP